MKLMPYNSVTYEDDNKEYSHITLDDIVRVETLGMGGFGRVELVTKLNLIMKA